MPIRTTASDFESSVGDESSVDDEVVEASIVVFLLDHHIGSKLLTNFYRAIAKLMKLNSNIINSEISNELIFHTKLSKSISSPPQLLYRGSRDGFKAIDFHSRCDNQGPTLTIIKSASEPTNQIFGGFTTQSWKSSDNCEHISDDLAFLFKIEENSSNQQLFRKFNIKQGMKYYAILNYKHYLSTFGKGHDLCIAKNCNLNKNSYSNFGTTYELPSNNIGDDEYKYGSKARSYLAGNYNFKVLEIEVFKIITTTTIIQ